MKFAGRFPGKKEFALSCLVWLLTATAWGFDPGGQYGYTNSPEVVERPVMHWGAKAEPAETNRYRIGTYNIQDFTDGAGDGNIRNWEVARRHAKLAAVLVGRMQADLLVLEEIENETALKMLNEALAQPYPAGVITDLGTGDTSGSVQKLNLAALSRIPIERATEIDFGPLTGRGRPTRGLLRLEVPLDDGRCLVVYAVHLKSNYGGKSDRNIAQRFHAMSILRANFDALRRSEPDRSLEVMVLGDTNVDPELEDFKTDESFAPLSDWRDLWRGVPIEQRTTIPTRYGDPALVFPPACFDRIFASPELNESPWTVGQPSAIPGGVLTENVNALPGVTDHVSDHYPVVIELVR